MEKKLGFLSFGFIVLTICIFFWQFLARGLLPIPSDTIIGLYHPFRDLYAKTNPNGIAYKNFLITDPVRQIIPWKKISLDIFERGQVPTWNPYEMTGKPLLANFQSGVFYPLNLLLFLKPFPYYWSLFILLQPLLGGLFLLLYLRSLKLDFRAIVFGVISFTFSGFFIAWLEWGNMLHTAVWLPLLLLSIDKLFAGLLKNRKIHGKVLWGGIYITSLTVSFFAGHLQVFFYLWLLSVCYFFARWLQIRMKRNTLLFYAALNIVVLLITSIQWIPTLQFIQLSARELDQADWTQIGWFMPWQHFVQFIIPDFFGNPTTLNYWGVWNYAEFIGYIGLVPLVFAVFALVYRYDKKTLFFGSMLFISLLFLFPTPVAKIPFLLNLPLISTAQPTRLLFIVCFSLSVLATLGIDYFLKLESRSELLFRDILRIIGSFIFIFILLWIFVLIGDKTAVEVSQEDLLVTKRNLLFPSAIFFLSSLILLTIPVIKGVMYKNFAVILLIIISFFDLLRFGNKFESFTKKEYFFPETQAISFLQNQPGVFRIASNDSRILPPNFATYYKIQSIEGYDPLYLRSYGEFIAALERNSPDISPPFGFNRIITPHNINSPLMDLLNVKYVLSLSNINHPKFTKVFEEGQTKIYENKRVLPRAFFVQNLFFSQDKDKIIRYVLSQDLKTHAAVETPAGVGIYVPLGKGSAEIEEYSENKIVIKTQNKDMGFLVITDSFYPTWKAQVDGYDTRIYKTNFTFRGVIVPAGDHRVILENK